MELQPFESEYTALVAGWASSAQEVSLLTGRDEYPFPSDILTSWRTIADDIEAYLYFDGATPIAYGELWLDDEEDEVELARLIVAPELRGQGIGTNFVRALLAPALSAGYSDIFLRVRPDNTRAIHAYLRAGFRSVDEALAASGTNPSPSTTRGSSTQRRPPRRTRFSCWALVELLPGCHLVWSGQVTTGSGATGGGLGGRRGSRPGAPGPW